MTSIRILWLLLCLGWIGAEIRLARKTKARQTDIVHGETRSQTWLWGGALASLGLAFGFKQLAWLPIPIDYLPRQAVALLVFAAGLGLRYWAIKTLGQFFTTHPTIQHRHVLISCGPYRWLRHPAYSGLLLALAAAGLAMGDGLALFVVTVPVFLTFNYRIGIEERLLQQKFATEYREYRDSTWKLIPWLF